MASTPAVSPSHAAPRKNVKPTCHGHQPYLVPGPESSSNRIATTASSSVIALSFRMRSLVEGAEDLAEPREIRGLGEVVVEARIERALPVAVLAPAGDGDQ